MLLGELVSSGNAPEVGLALLRQLKVLLRFLLASALGHHYWRVLLLLLALLDQLIQEGLLRRRLQLLPRGFNLLLRSSASLLKGLLGRVDCAYLVEVAELVRLVCKFGDGIVASLEGLEFVLSV